MIRRPPRSTLVERRRQRQMCIRDSNKRYKAQKIQTKQWDRNYKLNTKNSLCRPNRWKYKTSRYRKSARRYRHKYRFSKSKFKAR